MKKRWILSTVVLAIAVIVLGILSGLTLSRPLTIQQPVIVTGKVYTDSHYGGAQEALDEWDYSASCQVILRYAGAEGKATIAEGKESTWSIYVSSGEIVDQVWTDENGVYQFQIDRWPEGVFTGDINQEVTTVQYQVEILVPASAGYSGQKVFGSSLIKITKDTTFVLVPPFLLL